MGKREKEDSLKVLEGKKILNIKSFSLREFLLYPYHAWKEKKRQEKIRQSLFQGAFGPAEPKTNVDATFPHESKSNWVYKVVEEDGQDVKKGNWLDDLVSEDETKNKGE